MENGYDSVFLEQERYEALLEEVSFQSTKKARRESFVMTGIGRSFHHQRDDPMWIDNKAGAGKKNVVRGKL